ncbi:hypothetical protein HDIA_4864 [Hartmannibacter diazotrophicus]|uniref:SpoIIAA-like protein n=1 Tax=Hartmannibacter diazotrophicus TaxID=1482074 RepID=A0A2C9DEF8_9HYPH|nr:STAS/SEC14 domain-containing protein [Hartmannibacter diazotrophicus]SON58405.1 hypothetical protein HDIA_4864 [Hartmannibacter diazotrophicus]
MTTPTKSGFDILPGYDGAVIAISAKGHITADDYEKTLTPLVEERIASFGKIRFLYILGPEFQSFSAGAAFDDARLGLSHLGDFERIAVVTDIDWISWGMRLFAPLIPAPVRVLPVDAIEDAKAWISAD